MGVSWGFLAWMLGVQTVAQIGDVDSGHVKLILGRIS